MGKDAEEKTVLQEFYSGANVFITGATGFVGKVLIEKLLRSCPDVGNIYVLVRKKKGKTAQERIEEIINSKCFSRLLNECPDSVSKLVAVEGDIGFERLGISEQDCQLLAENVNIVFHAAASVNLAQHIGSAIKLNVRGTRDLLQLSKSFTKLKAFVHVSTAYAYCPIRSTDEKFYTPPLDCDEAIKMAERLGDDEIEAMTEQIIGKWPNTYSFTKAIAEGAVVKYGQNLGIPVGVYRPSVVMWTQAEPMPGWVDNFFGTIGIAAGIFSGLSHVMQMDGQKKINMVPCDVVCNGLIAGAWDVAQNWFPMSKAPVYHGVASAKNEMNWDQLIDEIVKNTYDKPSTKAICIPYMFPVKTRIMTNIYVFFLHLLPGVIIDGLFKLVCKKPQIMRKYRTIHSFQDVVAWFCVRDWCYEEKNLISLWNKMDARDKSLFPLDMRSMNWERYFRETFGGFRNYQMRESPESIPAARRRMTRLIWWHRVEMALLVVLGSACLYPVYQRLC